MERAGATSPPGAAASKSKEGRPDFTTDPRYQRLVPLMGVDSASALNDPQLRLDTFRQKAAALHNQQPGVQQRKPLARQLAVVVEDSGGAP